MEYIAFSLFCFIMCSSYIFSIALILGDGLYNFVKVLYFTATNIHATVKRKNPETCKYKWPHNFSSSQGCQSNPPHTLKSYQSQLFFSHVIKIAINVSTDHQQKKKKKQNQQHITKWINLHLFCVNACNIAFQIWYKAAFGI